jgi:hypothetical protein
VVETISEECVSLCVCLWLAKGRGMSVCGEGGGGVLCVGRQRVAVKGQRTEGRVTNGHVRRDHSSPPGSQKSVRPRATTTATCTSNQHQPQLDAATELRARPRLRQLNSRAQRLGSAAGQELAGVCGCTGCWCVVHEDGVCASSWPGPARRSAAASPDRQP